MCRKPPQVTSLEISHRSIGDSRLNDELPPMWGFCQWVENRAKMNEAFPFGFHFGTTSGDKVLSLVVALMRNFKHGEEWFDTHFNFYILRSFHNIQCIWTHTLLSRFLSHSGWHLVLGHHCHWVGQRGTSQLWPTPHEGPLPHPQKHSSHPGGALQQTFQRVCGGLSK